MNFFKQKYLDIDPDEVLLDSQNLPGFDNDMFEGRIEKPISKGMIIFTGAFFSIIFLLFTYKAYSLQVIDGEELFDRSNKNLLRHSLVFSDRGVIYDRNNVPLAWNEKGESDDFNLRKYIDKPGFSHVIGYVNYPQKDKAGFYYDTDITGILGVEKFYNDMLAGENGTKIVETDALNNVVSDNTIHEPQNGDNLMLTIDSRLQEVLFNSVKEVVDQVGFYGGGGVIMDIHTGDIVALTSYPDFDSNVMVSGDKEKVNTYLNDSKNPFLNRITQGLYTPGSIVKPYMAAAALYEKVITPERQILSTGKMIVPNPYDPDNPSVFTDWKAHGLVDVRQALAVSSNIYFYEIGGGYGDQKGLGITLINKYLRDFGFGSKLENPIFGEIEGTVPSPEWKQKIFDDDWRIGDTYFTSIGQYGFQVTAMQVVRAVSAIANGGTIVEPRIVADYETQSPVRQVIIDDSVLKIVRSGMREAVLSGTAKGLNYEDFQIAAKTGTAELGVTKERVNSWTTGFFPYENPRYAFVIVLEKGERHNLIGGVAVSRKFFDWLKFNAPEYIE